MAHRREDEDSLLEKSDSFAADLFHELHDEIKATAVRGHELVARMLQLEADLPLAKKALLLETNQLRFTHSTGVAWHARIYVRENHCSEGDLPQFIQNHYKECRSPPTLSLLDKFDINGAGACQKRYSDPSIFKAEWKISELKKLEKVLKDQKALQIKKTHDNKGIGRTNGDASEFLSPPRMVHYSSLSSEISIPCSDTGTKPKLPEMCAQISESDGLPGLSKKRHLPSPSLQTLGEFLETDENFQILRLSAKEMESEPQTVKCKGHKIICDFQQKAIETVREESHGKEESEDTASEADQYLDAIATMESETDSESGDRKETYNFISRILWASKYDNFKQESSSSQEMDPQSEDQLENPVLRMSHVSLSTNAPALFADTDANILLDNQVQAWNPVVQPIEDFAKDEMRLRRSETPDLSTIIAEISPDLSVHHLLSEPRVPSENQNAETAQDGLCLLQEPEFANYECLRHAYPNSPSLSVGMPSLFLANNSSFAELDINGNDIKPIPETPSSRMPESISSNISADLSGEPEVESSNGNSSSSASSPRSPLFSAINYPMSPIRFVCISPSSKSIRTPVAKMIRPSSPTLESKILAPPRLTGIPPTPPPLPPPRWRSKQALQSSTGKSPILMQASPLPPPFPPLPRLLSNEVQPIHQPKQTSTSILHGHRHDALIESISAYDRSKLRKVTAPEKQLAKPKTMDEIFLEQIRAKSLRLRHKAVQKHDAATLSQPDMLMVAAILEKAKAIRQAFSGSDQEDGNQG